MSIRKWNWGAFLSCPVWSIYHGFYFGIFSIFIPVSIWILLLLVKIDMPIVSQISFLFLVVVYCIYVLCLAPFIFMLETIFDVKNDYIRLGLFSIAFYLYWSAHTGMMSNDWLEKNKSEIELSVINENSKMWIVIGVLIFAPTILIVNYITVKSLIEITGFIGG